MPKAGFTPVCQGDYETVGDYEIAGLERRKMTLVPAGSYSVDLRPERNIDLRLSQETDTNGAIRVTAMISGTGPHHIFLRADNLKVDNPAQRVTLENGTPATLIWRGKLMSADKPWTIVAISDMDVAQRRELTAGAKQ